ncbi:hypothetical protein [Microbacterium sp. XT11]|uniref:hypothetical protein n=1 Tax=Microbacterium sp. XT11 TaxID=367477 RepID=UPI00082B461E|nr:hypothetical protein [Microbacterium sp. XT11]
MLNLNYLTVDGLGGAALLVEDSLSGTGGVSIRVTSAPGKSGRGAIHLDPKAIRKLVDRLEPHAAPKRTSRDDFDDLPVGAAFRINGDHDTRVKVSRDHYIVVDGHAGEAAQHHAGAIFPEFELTRVSL